MNLPYYKSVRHTSANGTQDISCMWKHRPVKQIRLSDNYDTLKDNLPIVTPSTLYTRRGDEDKAIEDFSGLFCFDIDLPKDVPPSNHIINNQVLELKDHFTSLNFIYACFLSPSRLGLRLILHTSYKPGSVDDFKGGYKRLYDMLQPYIENHPPFKIDWLPDPGRVFFLSYDHQPYHNPKAAKIPLWLFMKQADGLVEGSRNQAMTSIAGTLRERHNYDDSKIRKACLQMGRFCRPSLPKVEAIRIARSVCRYKTREQKTQEQFEDLGKAPETSPAASGQTKEPIYKRVLVYGREQLYISFGEHIYEKAGYIYDPISDGWFKCERSHFQILSKNEIKNQIITQAHPQILKWLNTWHGKSTDEKTVKRLAKFITQVEGSLFSSVMHDLVRAGAEKKIDHSKVSPYLIPTPEGLYDFDKDIPEIIDFDSDNPGHAFKSCVGSVPVYTRKWDDLIDSYFTKGDARYIQLVMGGALMGHVPKAYLMLIGPSNSGKSTFINMLRTSLGTLCGLLQESSMNLSDANNAMLVDILEQRPRFLLCQESGHNMIDVGILNLITGKDEIQAKRPYASQALRGVVNALLIVIGEKPIKIRGMTEGTINRQIPIMFKRPRSTKRDPSIIENSLDPKSDICKGMLYWLFEGAAEYMKHGPPKSPRSLKHTTTEILRIQNPFEVWAYENNLDDMTLDEILLAYRSSGENIESDKPLTTRAIASMLSTISIYERVKIRKGPRRDRWIYRYIPEAAARIPMKNVRPLRRARFTSDDKEANS